MKTMKLEFPLFAFENIFYVKTSLLLLNFCLYVYTYKVVVAQSYCSLDLPFTVYTVGFLK